jgi:peroxiredoxin
MTAGNRSRVDSFVVFLVVACVALAGLVVALSFQNRSLKQQLAQGSQPPPPEFHPGDVVEPFNVVADDGSTKPVAFGGGETKTVLLVFSAHCPACQDTVPEWRKIFATPPPAGIRVVGIQTDRLDPNPTSPVELAASFPFPVYGYRRGKPDPLSKVPFIPTALVIDAKGVVVKSWSGVPNEAAIGELVAQLK